MKRLVVVGTGMAGMATVEAVFSHCPFDRWEVVMVGREAEAPYDRVRLSKAIVDGPREEKLALHPPGWYERRGIRLLTGTSVEDVDVEGRVAVTDAGERLSYDALVLATGSRPLVPPIAGLEKAGVHLFRTLADARAIVAEADRGRRGLVIGGGLLGLEAARGLVARGMKVTVVHLVDRLMETQLDGSAAQMLEREMARLGVEVLRGRQTTEVVGNGRVEGLRFADGEEVEGEMVVISAGIRPDVELARRIGLEVERGVPVDDELRTSAPCIWAVGECAEHRGKVYGVWKPLLEQTKVAGASIAGQPAAFFGAVPATTLKVMGVDLFAAGRHSASEDGEDEVVFMDTREGLYRKLVLREGRLTGAILLGDLTLSRRLGELIRGEDPVPEELLALRHPAAQDLPADDNALVCTCNAVSRGTILAIARDRGLERADQVTQATRAGSGCGGCTSEIEALLGELQAERDDELRLAFR